MPLTVLAAPDKFRGTATAVQVASAVERAAARCGWNCVMMPLADGGEGMLEALGGPNRRTTVLHPLRGTTMAPWRLDDDRMAVMESAQVAGLLLAGGPERNDPVGASTEGVGQLIAEAITSGAAKVIVGLGGSASTDGGLGAVRVLENFAPFGPDRGTPLVVAYDVETTFAEAARRYGPQKGATTLQVRYLTRRLRQLQTTYLTKYGVDVSQLAGGGAAGGLAGGLAALGARLVPGFALVANHLDLACAIARADLVITGEGFLDEASYEGKVVGGVVASALAQRKPVLAIVGDADADSLARVGGVSLVARYGAEAAWHRTEQVIERAACSLLSTWSNGGEVVGAG